MDSIIERGIERIINRCDDIKAPWNDQTVLITGGAGFIGSWLTDFFIEKGSEVIVLDNLSSGLKSNIQHRLDCDKFSFIYRDVSDQIEIDRKIDYIFHLASRASPFEFSKFPIEILKANTIGILNTLEIARNQNSKFLYASTSEVYGNPDSSHVPTPENYYGNVNPVGPRSCYDESKRAGEAFVMAYLLEHDLNIRTVRIFNTYGPRMRAGTTYGRVIPNFVEQCLKNQPLSVFGDGSQTRSFSYITDTIEGILRAAFFPITKGEVINIGNTNEISILSLANQIIYLIKGNNNGKISFESLPIDDPKFRCPDISKANKILKWKPSFSLVEGLKEFTNWYKSNNEL